jgi:hypothetical protein
MANLTEGKMTSVAVLCGDIKPASMTPRVGAILNHHSHSTACLLEHCPEGGSSVTDD